MGDQFPKVRAAAVQASPVYLDREATVEKACQLIREAGEQGAEVIGFPECYIPGFPYWDLFASPVTTRRFVIELFRNAVEVPSESTRMLCQAAREARAYVVMGMNEKEPGTLGTMYNSQLFIGPEGEILGVHRKIMPTFVERLVHKAGDGSGLKVYQTRFGGLGGLICGENTNSLARFALLLQEERVHVASWPAFCTPWTQQMKQGIDIRVRYHAFEGKVFVVSATDVFDDRMVEMLCDTEEKRKLIINCGGYSSIIGPQGQYLAGPATEGEKILVADLDFEEIVAGKIVHDLTGHYNRFDILSLNLDMRPSAGLRITGEKDREMEVPEQESSPDQD